MAPRLYTNAEVQSFVMAAMLQGRYDGMQTLADLVLRDPKSDLSPALKTLIGIHLQAQLQSRDEYKSLAELHDPKALTPIPTCDKCTKMLERPVWQGDDGVGYARWRFKNGGIFLHETGKPPPGYCSRCGIQFVIDEAGKAYPMRG